VHLIGLTGGIASGKSLVSTRLAELGAVVIDADVLARDAVAPGSPGLARIVEEFGPEILTADGELDRRSLGRLVFGHPERLAALNAIVHPEVRRLAAEAVASAIAADPSATIVYDIPLLAETWEQRTEDFERVLVVEAPTDVRIERMVENRGMTEAEARSRVASQATDAERRAIATDLIDNSGAIEDTLAAVDEFWASVHG